MENYFICILSNYENQKSLNKRGNIYEITSELRSIQDVELSRWSEAVVYLFFLVKNSKSNE